MATFMELCNEVLRAHQETEFQSSNFAGARGYHKAVKDFVNAAVRKINQAEFEWPFNHQIGNQTLTAGTTTYDLPTDAKTVDWESFHIAPDDNLDPPQEAKKLDYMDYDRYMRGRLSQDLQRINDNQYDDLVPDYVFRNQALQFGVTPVPGQAFTVKYEYWSYPDRMVNHDDVCNIPDRFQDVIIQGAMHYAYRLRENWEAAGMARGLFKEGIKQMQTLLINRYTKVEDDRVPTVVTTFP